MLTEAMAVSTAEMSIIDDEKKVQEPEDDKVTQAELLANEALRLASESKRAAEKLAEIRAAIAFLQSKSHAMPQPTVSDEEKREEVPAQAVASPVAPVVVPPSAYAVSLLSKPELTVSTVEQREEKAEEASREVIASPAASVSSPVSILKKTESKVNAKEFRFSPEVVDPAIALKAKGAVVPSSTSDDDEPLIIKFCDALGMDRLCHLEIENEETPLTRNEKIAYIKNAFQMESANGGYIGVIRNSPHVAPEAESVPESTSEADAPVEEADAPATQAEAAPAEKAAAPVEQAAAAPVKQVVAAPAKQVVAAPAKQAAAPAEEVQRVEKADLTVDTSSDVVSEAGEGVLSPIKMQILANAIAPTVIHQADPFAGELDDMDYGMTCGWGA